MRALSTMAAVMMMVAVYVALTQALTSPELTARYEAYATARTTIRQAEERTRQVQAEQWNATVQRTVPWVAGGLVAAAVAGVGGWAVVEWQRNRTRRHEVTEDNTTQRHMITAKKDIALAYIAQCGDPGARQLSVNGVEGVYLPSSNELVPIGVCRAELAINQSTALARRTPHTINVPPVQRERRFLVVGETEQEDW